MNSTIQVTNSNKFDLLLINYYIIQSTNHLLPTTKLNTPDTPTYPTNRPNQLVTVKKQYMS